MEIIPADQKHTSQSFLYAAAKALERGSYYGVRSLLFIYMMKGPLGFDENESMAFYSAFAGSFLYIQFLGGVLGDLVTGNKNMAVAGGVLQTLGSFALCIPSVNAFFAGLIMICLGSGLFTPNILANFGKSYLNKPQLADGGFTFYYLAINIGAFAGVTFISLIGLSNFMAGFIIAGTMMLASTLLMVFSKTPEITIPKLVTANEGFGKIAFSIFILVTFWIVYSYAADGMYLLEGKLNETMPLKLPASSFTPTFAIFTGLAAAIIWTYWYGTTSFKWGVGFAFGAVVLTLLYYMSQGTLPLTLPFYVLTIFLLSVAEMLIAPTLYSILIRNANPKYFGILMAVSAIPFTFAFYVTTKSEALSGGGYFSLPVAALGLGILALVFLGMSFNKKGVKI